MPWILQMLGFGLLLIGIGVALWISVWVLLFFLVIGIAGVIWSHLREFLLEQGILKPRMARDASDEAEMPSITIVEGDFERVESKAEEISKE